MTTRTKCQTVSISGWLFLILAFWGLPLGIPPPYNWLMIVPAVGMFILSGHFFHRLKEEHNPALHPPLTPAQKKRAFWIGVTAGIAASAPGPFVLPVLTPNLTPIFYWIIPLITFLFFLAILWCSIFWNHK